MGQRRMSGRLAGRPANKWRVARRRKWAALARSLAGGHLFVALKLAAQINERSAADKQLSIMFQF